MTDTTNQTLPECPPDDWLDEWLDERATGDHYWFDPIGSATFDRIVFKANSNRAKIVYRKNGKTKKYRCTVSPALGDTPACTTYLIDSGVVGSITYGGNVYGRTYGSIQFQSSSKQQYDFRVTEK
ncbi:hypothetical protein [Kineosporia babensis]|uniref:Uncharacterized protein n=1 Tax=Kineosporia babensis TaxID=499548 RepID=A0A9X1NBJ5_9ACTN|nr:hypothetical protein [Kineosporia babensis]MCD5310699.1 hypothetical protein [Kineosporia babensis]